MTHISKRAFCEWIVQICNRLSKPIFLVTVVPSRSAVLQTCLRHLNSTLLMRFHQNHHLRIYDVTA